MPSSIAHASVAILLSPMLGAERVRGRIVAGTAVAAAMPDIDAVGRPFGLGDIAILGGHRAVTHSVSFALGAGVIAFMLVARGAALAPRIRLASYVTIVVLSHGALDAFTTYGEGVAFFAPVSMMRWKSSWQPLSGLVPEILAIWLPAFLVYQLWLKRAASRSSYRTLT